MPWGIENTWKTATAPCKFKEAALAKGFQHQNCKGQEHFPSADFRGFIKKQTGSKSFSLDISWFQFGYVILPVLFIYYYFYLVKNGKIRWKPFLEEHASS